MFVMAGLLIDAYRLRKYTAEFDRLIKNLLDEYKKSPKELKTSLFINGKKKWGQVDAKRRKEVLNDICNLAASCSKIFAVGFSFKNFYAAVEEADEDLPFDNDHWVAAAMFISALIQKKMQKEASNKGLTVLIFDDNKMDMPKVSDLLHTAPEWFDGLYQRTKSKSGQRTWVPVKPENRFNKIINSAFAIKSEHSSLVQVSDAVSYVYRRYLELIDNTENWKGEREYYKELLVGLEKRREKLGQTPKLPCLEFYNRAKHGSWDL